MADKVYLGFDLSTQQLKGVAVTSNLKLVHEAVVDFDRDFGTKYGVHKGVRSNPERGEIFAPTAMWLEALDLVLERLKDNGLNFASVSGLSGAGMQHGVVFWNHEAQSILAKLDSQRSLVEQLSGTDGAFAHPNSPNWQDSSTEAQCNAFDTFLEGNEEALANMTGSKAHHRFSGPQILRFRRMFPKDYASTARISLVSSFLASLFLGRFAPIDISDVCGMNLWQVRKGEWHEDLLELTGGSSDTSDIKAKLGHISEDGGGSIGTIAPYFAKKYGFSVNCSVAPFTGDNPSTILALPLRASDAIVSLGTSTTFLMSTPQYKPDPAYHFMNHPTTSGLYMFMLCYKNGGLAREQIRDDINKQPSSKPSISQAWDLFNSIALSTPPLGASDSSANRKLGLYFPRHEIVPNIPPGTWRYLFDVASKSLNPAEVGKDWQVPKDDARIIVESQLLSLRLRSSSLVSSTTSTSASSSGLPPQPRRIYLAGGGSVNPTIARICGDVLGGTEGVYQLDVGGNACALGSAYKAAWALERRLKTESEGGQTQGKGIRGGRDTETFEDFVSLRWSEEDFAKKVDIGYRKGVWEAYGEALAGFEQMEKLVENMTKNKG